MRRETRDLYFGELPSEKQIEVMTQIGAWQQLDLSRNKFTEVAKRAKGLYGAITAHALKEPAEDSGREKLIRALTIQIVILETLLGSGYRDLLWIRNALNEMRTGLREPGPGY